MADYQTPMQTWPELAQYARQVHLPQSNLDIFLYDSHPLGFGGQGASPMILVHGLGDEADTWRGVFPILAEKRRVIALDLPGFGRSSQPERAYTVLFYQKTLLELMDVLQLESVELVGHSLGAAIVQSLALEAPQRVEKLVLISGTLVVRSQPLNPSTLLFLVPGLGEWLYNRLRKNPQAAYQTLQPYYQHLDQLPQADRDFLFRRVNQRVWSDGQRRAFLSTLRNLVRWGSKMQKGLPDRLKDFKLPTLVIWGEADRINPLVNGKALIEMQPTAQLVTIPEAGHNVQQEKPQLVAQTIQNWDPDG